MRPYKKYVYFDGINKIEVSKIIRPYTGIAYTAIQVIKHGVEDESKIPVYDIASKLYYSYR